MVDPNYAGPPGLEYLETIQHLVMNKRIEYFELFPGLETHTKFAVKNAIAQNVRRFFVIIDQLKVSSQQYPFFQF